MRTDQIIYLHEIYQQSSLRKASDVLHISTQALSLSMRRLEEEMGFQILERSRTGVTLTKNGTQLLEIGLKFLENLQTLQKKPENKYPLLENGSLEVLATDGIIETFFPPLISQLFFDYPKFKFNPINCEFERIQEMLLNTAIDLAFIYHVAVDHDNITQFNEDLLKFTPLLSGSYCCTIPINFPIAHYNTLSLKTMLDYPIILFEPTTEVLLKLLENKNATPNIILTDNFSTYKQLLKTGAGLGFTFVFEQSEIPILQYQNVKLVPFKEKIQSTIGFLSKKEAKMSPICTDFTKYLTHYIKSNPISMLSNN